MRPTSEQIATLVAASPDIRPECIRQAGEHVDYLTSLAKSWIINGDEHHGAMLQTLCLAYGFQQTEIERLRVEGANQRAQLRDVLYKVQTWAMVNEIAAVPLDWAGLGALLAAVPTKEPPKECPYGDPYCPCQDGDQCHYVDDAGPPATAAWPCEHCGTAT